MKIALILLAVVPALAQQPADTIYHHGKIITMWEARPVVEAVAIRGNRFLLAGSNAEVLKTAGLATRKVDLKGQCVVPGLIESHVHPVGSGLSERDGPV